MAKTKRKKSLVAYAGFVDGELSLHDDKEYYGGVLRLEIFKIKSDAKKCYQDVRKVKIQEL